jgi:4-amino-4-deoxy-L-arabinose transferase-like glycosyltransferase
MLKTPHFISLVAIVILAAWLRTTQINELGILYGDAAHDLWSAQQAVEHRQLPLLGIESSLPRFRQGPVTVWLNMVLYLAFGYSLLPYALIYSFTSIMAVIALFFLVKNEVGTREGLVASFVLAVSPLAIAHARVPFIITPLPLILVLWLWSLLGLKQRTWKSVCLAFLAWGFLFQFELAVAPLFLVTLWQTWLIHKKITRQLLGSAFAGLTLGLLPQILHDLTHKGEQLGGFVAWVGYRFSTAFIPTTDHALGPQKFSSAAQLILDYGAKLFSVPMVQNDLSPVAIVFLATSLTALLFVLKKRNTTSTLFVLPALSSIVLLLAFIIHGSPSEAYFPPFLILTPLSLAGLFYHLKVNRFIPYAVFCLLVWLGVQSIKDMQTVSFFTDINYSFNYGSSVATQRSVVRAVSSTAPNAFLRTTNPAGVFPNYFDNLKWLAAEKKKPFAQSIEQATTIVWVEDTSSSLKDYPGAFIINEPPYSLIFLP